MKEVIDWLFGMPKKGKDFSILHRSMVGWATGIGLAFLRIPGHVDVMG